MDGKPHGKPRAFILFDPDVDGTTGALLFAHYLQKMQKFDEVCVIPVTRDMLALDMLALDGICLQYGTGELDNFLMKQNFGDNKEDHLVFVDILPYNSNSNLTSFNESFFFPNTYELLPASCFGRGKVFVFDEHIRMGSALIKDNANLNLFRVTPDQLKLGLAMAASGLVYNYVESLDYKESLEAEEMYNYRKSLKDEKRYKTIKMALAVANYADCGFKSKGREGNITNNIMSIPDLQYNSDPIYNKNIDHIAVKAKDILKAYYDENNISRSMHEETTEETPTFTPVEDWQLIFEDIPNLRDPDNFPNIKGVAQVGAASGKFDWLVPNVDEYVKLFHSVKLSEEAAAEWENILGTAKLVIEGIIKDLSDDLSDDISDATYVPFSKDSRCIIFSQEELKEVERKTIHKKEEDYTTGDVKLFPILRQLCDTKAPKEEDVNNIRPEWRTKLEIEPEEAVLFILVPSFDTKEPQSGSFGRAKSGDARFIALLFGGNGHAFNAGCPKNIIIEEIEDGIVTISSGLLA